MEKENSARRAPSPMAVIGRLLCRLHEDGITLQLDGTSITIEGEITDDLFDQLRDVKPILVGLLSCNPDHLPDEWRRMIYGLVPIDSDAQIDQANDSDTTSHTHGD